MIGSYAFLLPFLIRIFSLNYLLNLLTPSDVRENQKAGGREQKEKDEIIEKIQRYTKFWLMVFHPLSPAICWRRSILFYTFFRKAGMPVKLHFGIQADHSGFPSHHLIGHSWLTLNGTLFLEKEELSKGFKITYTFPPKQ